MPGQDAVSTTAEAMNVFVRQAAEQKKLMKMILPLESRIKALEDAVAKLTTRAPKGKEL